MEEDDELVLGCTSCKVVYGFALLDYEGITDPPIPKFCPFCGQASVFEAGLDNIIESIVDRASQRGTKPALKLVP